jgi:serine/threonine protein kinase
MHVGRPQSVRMACAVLSAKALVANGTFSRLILCANGEKQVVVKVTRACESTRVAELCQREVDISVQVGMRPTCEFVVRCHGWLATSRGEICLLLEYLPGGDISTLIDRDAALPSPLARFYAACTALALEELHSRRIVHRDVKPDNLCVDADGYAKLCDLGFARTLADGDRARTQLGTPDYLCPEALLGNGFDARGDVWALGVTLYAMLLARLPFSGGTVDAVVRSVCRDAPRKPPRRTERSAVAFMDACLSRDAERRPSARNVWSHPFFAPLRRNELETKRMTPPMLPVHGAPPRTPHTGRHGARTAGGCCALRMADVAVPASLAEMAGVGPREAAALSGAADSQPPELPDEARVISAYAMLPSSSVADALSAAAATVRL